MDTGGVHLLFDSALFEKIGFNEINHYIEHGDGLIYQGQHHVAEFFIVEAVGERGEKCGVIVIAAGFPQIGEARMILAPELNLNGSERNGLIS